MKVTVKGEGPRAEVKNSDLTAEGAESMLIFGDNDPKRFPCRRSVTFHHFWSPPVQIIRFERPLDPVRADRDSGRDGGRG